MLFRLFRLPLTFAWPGSFLVRRGFGCRCVFLEAEFTWEGKKLYSCSSGGKQAHIASHINRLPDFTYFKLTTMVRRSTASGVCGVL